MPEKERLNLVKKSDGLPFTDEEKYIRDKEGAIIRATEEYLSAVINQADEGEGGGPQAAAGN